MKNLHTPHTLPQEPNIILKQLRLPKLHMLLFTRPSNTQPDRLSLPLFTSPLCNRLNAISSLAHYTPSN